MERSNSAGVLPDAEPATDRSAAEALIHRLATRQAVIGIVGLGYVGLPLVLTFANAAYRVLGFDIDPDKVQRLNRGESYIEHISDSKVANAVQDGFEATADLQRASEADAVI